MRNDSHVPYCNLIGLKSVIESLTCSTHSRTNRVHRKWKCFPRPLSFKSIAQLKLQEQNNNKHPQKLKTEKNKVTIPDPKIMTKLIIESNEKQSG